MISISWQKNQAYDIGLSEAVVTVDIPPSDQKQLQDSITNESYGGMVPSKKPGRSFPSTFTVPAWFDYGDKYSDDNDECAERKKDEDLGSGIQPSMDIAEGDASGCGATRVTEEIVKLYNRRPGAGRACDKSPGVLSQRETDHASENGRSQLLEIQVSTLTREKEEEIVRRQQAESRIAELEDHNNKEIQRGKKDKAEVIRLGSELRRMGKKFSIAANQQSSERATRQEPSDETMRMKHQDPEKELGEAKQKCTNAERVVADTKKHCQELTSSRDSLEESKIALEGELQAALSRVTTLEEQVQGISRASRSAQERITGLEAQVSQYEGRLRNSIPSEQVELAQANYARLEANLEAAKARLAQVDSGEAEIVSMQDINVGRNRLEDQAKEIHKLNHEIEKVEASGKNQIKEVRRLNEEKEKAEKSGKETFDRHLNLQKEFAKEYENYKEQQKKIEADFEDKDIQLRAAKEDIARLEHALQAAGLPQDTVLLDPQMCGNPACRMWKSRTENTFKDRITRMNRQFKDTKEDRDSCRKQLDRLELEKDQLKGEAKRNRQSFIEYERRLAQQDVKSAQEAVRNRGENGSSPAQPRCKRSDNDQGQDRPVQKAKIETP